MIEVMSMSDAVDKTIKDNPDKVAQVKEKPWNIGWFVGNVLSMTGGKADPDKAKALLKERMDL